MDEAYRTPFETFLSYVLLESEHCRLCRKAFRQEDDDRVTQVNAACGQSAGCELYKASIFSPGRVSDTEVIHFLITDPQAVDPRSGKLLPGLLSQLDKKGLSFLRQGATNVEFEITFKMMKRGSDSRGQERFLYSVSTVTVNDVRFHNNERLAGVYDTAVPERPNHADVMGVSTEKKHRERRKKRLLELLDAGNVGVAQFRNGVFAVFARPTL